MTIAPPSSFVWYHGFCLDMELDEFKESKAKSIRNALRSNTFFSSSYASSDFNGAFFTSNRAIAKEYAEHCAENIHEMGHLFVLQASISAKKVFDCAVMFPNGDTKISIQSLADLSDAGRDFARFLVVNEGMSESFVLNCIRRMRYYDHGLFNPYIMSSVSASHTSFDIILQKLEYEGFYEKDPVDTDYALLPRLETVEYDFNLKLREPAICIFSNHLHTVSIDHAIYRVEDFQDEEETTNWRLFFKRSK